MKRVRVARSATVDLDEIWTYIARRDGADAAQRLIDSLTNRFAFLSRHPRAGRDRADLSLGLRSFSAGHYRIYYRVESGAVRILHVRHTARDEGALALIDS